MFNRPKNSGSSNNSSVPDARAALDNMKMEIAKELGIDVRRGYHGELPSRVGGQMVKQMIQQQEKEMSSQRSKPLS